jgi:hypothetical protein
MDDDLAARVADTITRPFYATSAASLLSILSKGASPFGAPRAARASCSWFSLHNGA